MKRMQRSLTPRRGLALLIMLAMSIVYGYAGHSEDTHVSQADQPSFEVASVKVNDTAPPNPSIPELLPVSGLQLGNLKDVPRVELTLPTITLPNEFAVEDSKGGCSMTRVLADGQVVRVHCTASRAAFMVGSATNPDDQSVIFTPVNKNSGHSPLILTKAEMAKITNLDFLPYDLRAKAEQRFATQMFVAFGVTSPPEEAEYCEEQTEVASNTPLVELPPIRLYTPPAVSLEETLGLPLAAAPPNEAALVAQALISRSDPNYE